MAGWDGRVSDTSISVWHFHNDRQDVRICPSHLHYDMPSVPERR
jgi:hypothetical protein